MPESVMDAPQVTLCARIYMSSDRVSRGWGKIQKGRVKAADGEGDKNL